MLIKNKNKMPPVFLDLCKAAANACIRVGIDQMEAVFVVELRNRETSKWLLKVQELNNGQEYNLTEGNHVDDAVNATRETECDVTKGMSREQLREYFNRRKRDMADMEETVNSQGIKND